MIFPIFTAKVRRTERGASELTGKFCTAKWEYGFREAQASLWENEAFPWVYGVETPR